MVLTALALVIVLDVVAVASDISEYRLLTRAIDGEVVSQAELDENNSRQSDIGVAQIVVFVIAAVPYLAWMYRARKNLDALGAAGLTFDARWGVSVWFIPIWNLFRPYQLSAEIARASDPHYSADGDDWKAGPAPNVLGFWWAAWLMSGVVGRLFLAPVLRNPETYEDFRNRAAFYAVSDGLDIVAALLTMLVVIGITSAQDKKSRVRQARADLAWESRAVGPA